MKVCSSGRGERPMTARNTIQTRIELPDAPIRGSVEKDFKGRKDLRDVRVGMPWIGHLFHEQYAAMAKHRRGEGGIGCGMSGTREKNMEKDKRAVVSGETV